MKSKTSCYEPALGRMELRRFAPAFALYAVGLFLLTMNILGNELSASRACEYTSQFASMMAPINLAYAAVLAQLLLGDLYTTRLSFGLRSLPMTTGGWYGTQIILGILGSLIPNALNAALMLLYVREYQIVVFWWLLSSQLQFLCFYGIAVLCAVCAGNRIGMLILYTIVNFANLFVSWLISQLYIPLVYGLSHPGLGAPLSPVYVMNQASIFQVDYKYMDQEIVREFADGPSTSFVTEEYVDRLYLTSHFWTLMIWAAVGIAAIWLGLRLLRKARAESSGDLLAFPRLEPAILLLVTLGMGTAFHIASDIFTWDLTYLLLSVGLIIGYFGCLMLLQRQVNVFTKKAFVPLLGIFAAVFLSLTITGLDVLGIHNRIPDADQVESVTLDSATPITDRELIETVIGIHETVLREGNEAWESLPLPERIFANKQDERVFPTPEDVRMGDLTLNYTLKDGSTMTRIFFMSSESAAAPAARQILSRPEMVFRGGMVDGKRVSLLNEDGSFTSLLGCLKSMTFTCYCPEDGADVLYSNGKETRISLWEDREELLNAMKADCEAGTMAQTWLLRGSDGFNHEIELYYDSKIFGGSAWFHLYIGPECENTFRWLVDHGYHEAMDN